MHAIIPVISFATAFDLATYGLAHQGSTPYQLLGTPQLPEIVYKSNALWMIFGRLTGIQHLYAYASIDTLTMILLSGIISVIYAAIYRMLGPARWGPMDMPPPKFKPKKYTR